MSFLCEPVGVRLSATRWPEGLSLPCSPGEHLLSLEAPLSCGIDSLPPFLAPRISVVATMLLWMFLSLWADGNLKRRKYILSVFFFPPELIVSETAIER